jgi:ATP-dependent RNA helicase DDX56/DBP9
MKRKFQGKSKARKVVMGRNGKVDPLKTFNARGRGKKA